MSDEISVSIERKIQESAATLQAFFSQNAAEIARSARALLTVFERGGRLWVMGNGGSACDAQHIAVEFCHPIFEKRRALPAIALPADIPFTTAIGNDEDFALGFARQIELHARPEDAALGISTSGRSRNVTRALGAAKQRGLLTIGFAGRDGGDMPRLCDHCFVVESFSIHRIQETHTALAHVLWDAVHLHAGEDDVL